MKWIRVGYRLAGFVLITLVLVSLRLAPKPILTRLKKPRDRVWRDKMFGVWARSITRLVGIRAELSGPLPATSFFVVSNHLGYVDVILLASVLPAVFVAKAEVAHWPFLGPVVRSVGTIFVDRGNKASLRSVNQQIETALDNGDRVILFGEGTSSGGDSVLPIKPSLLQVPATRKLSVRYAAIRYVTEQGEPAARDAVCWWGDKGFMPHLLGLLALKGFTARLSFGRDAIVEDDRKQLALRMHEAIGAELATLT